MPAEDLVAAFLRALRSWAGAHARLGADAAALQALFAGIDAEAAALDERHAAYRVDAPSTAIVRHAATVVAAHRGLCRAGLDAAAANAAIIDAMACWVRVHQEAYTFARLGIRRDQPSQAFEMARINFRRRGEERFGAHFRYEQVVDAPDCSIVHITRCLYHELMQAMDAREVTPVFCAMDMVWAADVTQPMYGIRFERPTTLARDGQPCSFEFYRRDG
jgi:hypothetical protein